MDRELLELLACPKCRGPLEEYGEVTALRCPQCMLLYRVDDGIPVLLMDQATPCE